MSETTWGFTIGQWIAILGILIIIVFIILGIWWGFTTDQWIAIIGTIIVPIILALLLLWWNSKREKTNNKKSKRINKVSKNCWVKIKGMEFHNISRKKAEEMMEKAFINCIEKIVPDDIQKKKEHYFNPIEKKVIIIMEKKTDEYERIFSILVFKPELYLLLGNAEYYKNNIEKAIAYFDRALEINPKFEDAFFNKGVIFGYLNKPEEAIECYNEVLKINPKDEEALFNNGVVFGYLKKHKKALEYFDKIIYFNSKNEKAWCEKGRVLALMGKYNEAIKCLNKALEINPEFVKAKNLILQILEYLKRYQINIYLNL